MAQTEPEIRGVVTTIAAKCRRCYNCVRSCPAQAIRVQAGQANVLPERCIGCGNCIKVCAQHAKQVEPAAPQVRTLLAAGTPVVAVLAPSYPAAYEGLSAAQVVGAVRALGFARVMEVGFGAEMVAQEYARRLKRPAREPMISTPCPALVSYVLKYMPDLAPHLAPVVSPMVAMGRAVKERYLPGAAVVFIGPCIAKKAELRDPEVAGAIDAALTFQELEELWSEAGITPDAVAPGPADEPLPRYGALFPVSGGLLKAAAIQADLMEDSIQVIEGPGACLAALKAVQEGEFQPRFLDALLCEGCVAGPAYSGTRTPLARKALVTAHVRELAARARPQRSLREVAKVALERGFRPQPITLTVPSEREIRDILLQTNKSTPEAELNCGACGYPTCRDKAIAVYQGLAEPEMCLPYLIDQLQVNVEKLSRSKEEIEKAREQALRAQQLASMGQFAADLAHEMSDPLARLMAFAELMQDGLPEGDARREDLQNIVAEAAQCREVMGGLECFARQREPQWEQVQVGELITEVLEELAPKLQAGEVEVLRRVGPLPPLLGDPALLRQVLINLLTNSLESLAGPGRIEISAAEVEGAAVEIVIHDTGRGIDPSLLPRLFQPFVTTQAARPGAGLGLAVAHGIVQTHGGEIDLQSKPGFGTTVTLRLPLHLPAAPLAEGAKVLVVDDDLDFLEQHRIMLEGMGFQVVTAERSDEALEVAQREIPDAFVLDLMMERTDSGARLARALRRDPRFRGAPIVLLTAVGQEMGFEFERNPREVLEWMKADAWFDKPAPMAELSATIRRLLAGEKE